MAPPSEPESSAAPASTIPRRRRPMIQILLLLLPDAAAAAAAASSSGISSIAGTTPSPSFSADAAERIVWSVPLPPPSRDVIPGRGGRLLDLASDGGGPARWRIGGDVGGGEGEGGEGDDAAAATEEAVMPGSLHLSIMHRGRLYPIPPPRVTAKAPRRRGLGGRKRTRRTSEEEDGGPIPTATSQPSAATLAAVTGPLIPTDVWSSLTGTEFDVPRSFDALATTGIRTAVMASSDVFVDWTPSRATMNVLEDNGGGGTAATSKMTKALIDDGTILVWTGKFRTSGYGSSLPLVRTVSIVPMSPRTFAELLMDSSKVRTYNKMSLGRTDVKVFQKGVDTVGGGAGAGGGGSFGGIDGEAKVVRNLTQPPLSKRKMEFVTAMYARRLREGDGVDGGLVGGTPGKDGTGYVVVSRAVNDGGGDGGGGSGEEGGDDFIRSEILLGVNLVRPVPGEPDLAEVTAVTHCNSPSVPTMLAGKVGVKGAVDFVKDVRALCVPVPQ